MPEDNMDYALLPKLLIISKKRPTRRRSLTLINVAVNLYTSDVLAVIACITLQYVLTLVLQCYSFHKRSTK